MPIFVKKNKPGQPTAFSQPKPAPVAVIPASPPAPVFKRVIHLGKPKTRWASQKEAQDDLVAVGLAEGFRPNPVLAPMLRPHYEPGQRVSVVTPGASRFICKTGDTGTVSKVVPAMSPHDKLPDDDLYFVELDTPRTSKTRAYLTFAQLKAA